MKRIVVALALLLPCCAEPKHAPPPLPTSTPNRCMCGHVHTQSSSHYDACNCKNNCVCTPANPCSNVCKCDKRLPGNTTPEDVERIKKLIEKEGGKP